MPARTNRIKQDGKKVSVEIRVNIVEDHGYFVACSPALDLTTYAKTPEMARERFLEAVGIFFEDTLQKGTLEKVLLGLGWKLQKKPTPRYQPPRSRPLKHNPPVETHTEQVAIPLSFPGLRPGL